jgi:hypothetical protein
MRGDSPPRVRAGSQLSHGVTSQMGPHPCPGALRFAAAGGGGSGVDDTRRRGAGGSGASRIRGEAARRGEPFTRSGSKKRGVALKFRWCRDFAASRPALGSRWARCARAAIGRRPCVVVGFATEVYSSSSYRPTPATGSHPGPATSARLCQWRAGRRGGEACWSTRQGKASRTRRPSGLQEAALLLPAALCFVDQTRRQVRLTADAAVEVMLVQ